MEPDPRLSLEPLRPTAVAGSWYPGQAGPLNAEIDRHLAAAAEPVRDRVLALIVPHAGLMYSGPVAAHAYGTVRGRSYDVAVLVGPSHFIGFDGVSIYERGAFATPLGPVPIAATVADRIRSRSHLITSYPAAHKQEHSLELQLPFLRRVLPETPIVPLVIGHQVRATILALADVLADALVGTRVLLVASTDLSHYFDGQRAAELDGRVVDYVDRFDTDGLLDEFERYPEYERGRHVACGGGAAVSVMRAAWALGARQATVLKRADSGDVSGDKRKVVGYLAGIVES